jgi:hypothetical protein
MMFIGLIRFNGDTEMLEFLIVRDDALSAYGTIPCGDARLSRRLPDNTTAGMPCGIELPKDFEFAEADFVPIFDVSVSITIAGMDMPIRGIAIIEMTDVKKFWIYE